MMQKRWIGLFSGLLLGVSVFGQLADNADPRWFPVSYGQPGIDYDPTTLVVKLRPESRFLFNDLQSSWAFRAKRMGLGTPEKAFPNESAPTQTLNAYGLPTTDLSLIYEVPAQSQVPIQRLVSLVLGTGLFEWAEPLPIVQPLLTPNDPSIGSQYYFSRIRAFDAYDKTTGDTNVVIAIVDGGTNFTHPDLLGNIKYNYADPIDGIDNDGDGYIDNFRGWDVGDGDNNPSYNPSDGATASIHGTAMCGIAAATTDNAVGIAGIGWKCKYLPVKMVRTGQGWVRGYQAVAYAVRAGADIINCSWGGTYATQLGRDVMCWAVMDQGKLVIAAAGNSNNTNPIYPAAFEEVLGVTATNVNDIRWSGSSYYELIELAAPGESIYRTYGTGYATGSGSSEASSVVSGSAGIVLSQFPWMTPFQIGARLKATSVQIDNLPGNAGVVGRMGYGRIDLKNAVIDSTGAWMHFRNRQFSDEDGDGIFFAGDTVLVTGLSLNALRPSTSALSARITHNSAHVQLLDSTLQIGVVGSMQSFSHAGQPFRFIVKNSCPVNHLVRFRVTYQDTARAGHTDFFLFLQPDHYNWTSNKNQLTLGNNGRLGYTDAATQTGIGWRKENGPNNLLEQFYAPFSLMIGHNSKVSNATLSDPLAGCCPLITDNHFVSVQPMSKDVRGNYGDVRVISKFNDSGAGVNAIGVEVTRIAYGDSTGPLSNVIFMDHVVRNTNATGLKNVFIGYYCDQDVADTLFFTTPNQAGWDVSRRLGWQISQLGGRGSGMVLLTGTTPHYYAFDVGGGGGSIAVTNGFSQSEKWTAMTGGIGRSLSTVGDPAQYLGTVIDSLAPGNCAIVSMAFVVGDQFSDIQNAAQLALTQYQNSANVWTGAAGTANWHHAGNWSAGVVPTSSHRVYVIKPSYPGGFDPVISDSNGQAAYIETLCGGHLRISNGRQLQVGP